MSAHPQNYRNHTRLVPAFHFLFGGMASVATGIAFNQVARAPGLGTLFNVLVALSLLLLGWYVRAFALGVQDRVIRLEMRLRLERLLPADQHASLALLTTGQIVALRFASDAELPGLVRQVLEGRLVRAAEIKRQIRDWQPDDVRI
jgi:hypothetical protein